MKPSRTDAPDPVGRLMDLVEELCDVVDHEGDDVGGSSRGSLTILREMGPVLAEARKSRKRPGESVPIAIDDPHYPELVAARLHLFADADVMETARDGTFEYADAVKWADLMQAGALAIARVLDDVAEARRSLETHRMSSSVLGHALRRWRETTDELATILLASGEREPILLAGKVRQADEISKRALAVVSPEPGPSDTERLRWLVRRIPGSASRRIVHHLSDSGSLEEWRRRIDHQMTIDRD